jgi:hypothetical protein
MLVGAFARLFVRGRRWGRACISRNDELPESWTHAHHLDQLVALKQRKCEANVLLNYMVVH